LKYALILYLLIGLIAQAWGQKLSFDRYQIENALIHSQVAQISQDSSGMLWVTSQGGISRFDGTAFSNITNRHGLMSRTSFAAVPDRKGAVWVSTSGGVSIFRNKTVRHINYPRFKTDWVGQIVCDYKGRIWGAARGALFLLSEKKVTQITFPGKKNWRIASIRADKDGVLWVNVYQVGLFSVRSKWKKEIDYSFVASPEYIRNFFIDKTEAKIWLITGKNLYLFNKGKINTVQEQFFRNNRLDLLTVFQDYHKNV